MASTSTGWWERHYPTAVSVTLNVVGWVLLILGSYALCGSMVALAFPNQYESDSPTAAAALIAIAGLLLTLAGQHADKAEATSRFYLKEYRRGFGIAHKILRSALQEGDPYIRVKWLAAARAIESARRLSEQVTVRAHREVLYMDIPFQSQRFQPFFAMSAYYYYGSSQQTIRGYKLRNDEDFLNEAARQSTQGTGAGNLQIQRAVDEKVLNTIWRAIQYPPEYAEVLGQGFAEADEIVLPPTLRDYIEHRRTYRSVMGKLYQGKDEIPRPL
jgi:hypothetical protein